VNVRALKIDGVAIKQEESLKYLGVTVDPKLSFAINAEIVAAKAKRAIGTLWRSTGKWAASDIFSRIYSSNLLPILT
jgi:hypothetical protein